MKSQNQYGKPKKPQAYNKRKNTHCIHSESIEHPRKRNLERSQSDKIHFNGEMVRLTAVFTYAIVETRRQWHHTEHNVLKYNVYPTNILWAVKISFNNKSRQTQTEFVLSTFIVK